MAKHEMSGNANPYQSDDKRLVEIFRAAREEGFYLYVDKKEGLQRVPPDLLARLGKLETAMLLMLEPDKKLARADAARVLQAIRDQGFYLQMPPRPELQEQGNEMYDVSVHNSRLAQ
ncbi:MAG TPA: YcgL domain-containing protein [Pseudomonadales bacterium]|nr:YcgL domain-containing protein [Pseudomonadales bacterium]